MSQKLKSHLKWIVPIAVVILLLALFMLSQFPRIISVTVSPEVIVKGQGQEVTVTVLVKPRLFIAPKLKAVMTEQGYKGSPVTQNDWIKFYSVFQLNPKILGNLTNTGKDEQGNIVYKCTFTVDNSTAETVQIQPTNMFGMNLTPNTAPISSRLAITTRPAALPPDPGEAGKATLEGIDSDHDGLRDDVQREIFFLAPQSERLRMGLTQIAKPLQGLASMQNLSSSDVDSMLKQFFDGDSCFNALVGRIAGVPDTFINYQYASSPNYLPEVNEGIADENLLFKAILNTKARTALNIENNDKSGPGSTGITDIKRCSFNPSDYQD